jgi:alpha-ribazole phosphatase
MKLYVIRHPEPLDAEGICYGQSDLDVSDEVLAITATHLKDLLQDKPIDLYLSSPLQRCSKLAAELSSDFVTDERLLEMHFGIWEGLAWDDIDRQAFDAWAEDYVHNQTPDGESFLDVQARVKDLLIELSSRELETVAIIGHAAVIRALLGEVLDIPLESTWRFSVGFGALLVFEVGAETWQNHLLEMTAGIKRSRP